MKKLSILLLLASTFSLNSATVVGKLSDIKAEVVPFTPKFEAYKVPYKEGTNVIVDGTRFALVLDDYFSINLLGGIYNVYYSNTNAPVICYVPISTNIYQFADLVTNIPTFYGTNFPGTLSTKMIAGTNVSITYSNQGLPEETAIINAEGGAVIGTNVTTGDIIASNSITSPSYVGNGAYLTNIPGPLFFTNYIRAGETNGSLALQRLFDASAEQAWREIYIDGNVNMYTPVVVSNAFGLKMNSRGRYKTRLISMVTNASALTFYGMSFCTMDSFHFYQKENNTNPVVFIKGGTEILIQGNVFRDCMFTSDGKSDRLFQINESVNDNTMGSENRFYSCSFNSARYAALLIYGYNAVNNGLYLCNFSTCTNYAIYLDGGSVKIYGGAMQNTPYNNYDVMIVNGGGVGSEFHGIRSESLRFLFAGNQFANVYGLETYPSIPSWNPSKSYSIGTIVVPRTNLYGCVYKATTYCAATNVEPIWPSSGSVTNDGMIWKTIEDHCIILTYGGSIVGCTIRFLPIYAEQNAFVAGNTFTRDFYWPGFSGANAIWYPTQTMWEIKSSPMKAMSYTNMAGWGVSTAGKVYMPYGRLPNITEKILATDVNGDIYGTNVTSTSGTNIFDTFTVNSNLTVGASTDTAMLNIKTNARNLFSINAHGRVVVNSSDLTQNGDTAFLLQGAVHPNASAGNAYGFYSYLDLSTGTDPCSVINQYIRVSSSIGAPNLSSLFGSYSEIGKVDPGTVPNVRAYSTGGGITDGRVYDWCHYYAGAVTMGGSGTISAQYGLYVASLGGADANYAIYTAGTTPSYFGGSVTVSNIIATNTAGYDLGKMADTNWVLTQISNSTMSVTIAASNTLNKTGVSIVCDGINDDIELYSALSSNTDVLLGPGHYSIRGMAISNLYNLRIRGSGIGVTTIDLYSNLSQNGVGCVNAMYFLNCTNITISDLSIVGPSTAQTNVIQGIESYWCENVLVERCNISQCNQAVSLDSVIAGTVRDCIMRQQISSAGHLFNVDNNVSLTNRPCQNIKLLDCQLLDMLSAAKVEQCIGFIGSGNTFSNSPLYAATNTYAYSIIVGPNDTPPDSLNTVFSLIGNHVFNGSMCVSSTDSNLVAKLIGNEINGGSIVMIGGASNVFHTVTIQGNTIAGSQGNAIHTSGLNLTWGNLVINNNTILRCTNGIYLGSTNITASINGNVICDLTGSWPSAIRCDATNATIIGNTISWTNNPYYAGYGIYLRWNGRQFISANKISGVYYGIELEGSSSNIISGNTIAARVAIDQVAYSGKNCTGNKILFNEYFTVPGYAITKVALAANQGVNDTQMDSDTLLTTTSATGNITNLTTSNLTIGSNVYTNIQQAHGAVLSYTLADNTQRYMAWPGVYQSTTEAYAQLPFPRQGPITELYVHIPVACSADTNIVFTIYTNGVASPVTCTLYGGTTSANVTNLSTGYFPPGTGLSIGFKSNYNGGGHGSTFMVSFR